MIKVHDAIKVFNNRNKDRIIKHVFDSGSNYLIYAPGKLVTDDDSDPYFTMDKETGEIKHFSPISNMRTFISAMNNKLV